MWIDLPSPSDDFNVSQANSKFARKLNREISFSNILIYNLIWFHAKNISRYKISKSLWNKISGRLKFKSFG